MASKRRGGFRPPELRGTLGTLLRTTTGVVRDALERGAREGRARLDDARASRRRADALAELGELVLDLIRRGEIDLAELPEARDLVRLLDEFDATSSDPEPEPRRLSPRRRFDDRPPRRDTDDDRRSRSTTRDDDRPRRDTDLDDDRFRRPDDLDDDRRHHDDAAADDRPHRDHRHADADRDSPRRDTDDPRPRRDTDDPRPRDDSRGARPRRNTDRDGTVSSGLSDRDLSAALADRTTRPTTPARPKHDESPSTRAPTQPIKTIWRPLPDDASPIADTPEPRRTAPPPFRDPTRKGGITFDDDDLSEYMHPDDVPPRPAPDDPSAPADSDPSHAGDATAPGPRDPDDPRGSDA